jgi:hypothetical protein
MFDFIPNDLREATRGGAWLNQLKRALTRKQIVSSTDILLSETPYGTALTVSDKIKMKWNQGGAGPFGVIPTFVEASASTYPAGQLVIVDINAPYSNSFNQPTSSAIPSICAGLFQRNNYPSGSYTIPYPVCPIPPSSSYRNVSGSNYNVPLWNPIIPELPLCIPGYSQPIYVACQVSESMLSFNPGQLPYPI